MPRNSSGTYSTPAGQPVVTGTVVSSSVQNNLVGDLANEITQSLDRSGRGGMNAPIRTPDGTLAAPAHSFTNETNSGLRRNAAGDVRLTVLGVDALQAQSAGVTVPGTLGVTGATTLGNATVGGTLGVTGAATLNGGATLASGGLTLSQAANQPISKSGGDLVIGTSDAHSIQFTSNNVIRFALDTAGNLGSNGVATIASLPAPANPGDAANKGYVDGTDGSAGVVAGANVAIANVQAWKSGASVITVRALVVPSTSTPAGTSRTLMTLPAGYRPTNAPTVTVLLYDSTARTLGAATIQADGTVFTVTGVTSGDSYSFSMAFSP